MKRIALAQWKGSGAEGSGTLSTPMSKFMNEHPYSFVARFKNDDGELGTNPEELIMAAHAGCFAMKLSFVIGSKGFTPNQLDVKGTLTFEDGTITNIHLDVKASVDGMSAEDFAEAAEEAKINCPVSKVLNAEITMDASLV